MVASESETRIVGWRVEAQRWQAEAQRWEVEAQRLDGDNVGLRAQVGELEGQVAALKETVATLSRALYGDSSEKQPKQQPEPERTSADDTAETGDASGGAQGPSDKRRRGQQPGSRGHGRRDYSHLPADEHVHEPDPNTLVCPSCGAAYVRFGQESCEQIDWEVVVRRVVHRRPAYRRGCDCTGAKGIVSAPPPPRPIAKGRFTSGFVARQTRLEEHQMRQPRHRSQRRRAGTLRRCTNLIGHRRDLPCLLTDPHGASAQRPYAWFARSIRQRCVGNHTSCG